MKTATYNAPTGEDVPVRILETFGPRKNFAKVRVLQEVRTPGVCFYRLGDEFDTTTMRLTAISESA